MQEYIVKKSKVSGNCSIPTSKSQSIRAILFATMASGISNITKVLASPDIAAMISACKQLGADIQRDGNNLVITGISGKLRTPDDVIDSGNSGQVLRFIACLAGLQKNYIVITGDASIRHNRPVQPLLEALPQLGVSCESLRGDGYAPLIMRGAFNNNTTTLSGEDSQPVSGLLMAACFINQTTKIEVRNAGEKPWIDLTLTWLDKFAVPYVNTDYEYYEVTGGRTIDAFDYQVPGDLSSLSFPLAAALVTGSELLIENVDLSEPQGDKAIVEIVQQMGAQLTIDAVAKTIKVHSGAKLTAIEVDINHCIDCIAILAVLGCFAAGVTTITGAAIARQKESDRIAAITKELTAMGAQIEPLDDGMIITGAKLQAAKVDSHHDHRIAMALAVAGMAIDGTTKINNTACVVKSFPGFATIMQQLGADIIERELS